MPPWRHSQAPGLSKLKSKANSEGGPTGRFITSSIRQYRTRRAFRPSTRFHSWTAFLLPATLYVVLC